MHFATHVIEEIAVFFDSQLMNFYFLSFNLSMIYKIFMKNLSHRLIILDICAKLFVNPAMGSKDTERTQRQLYNV